VARAIELVTEAGTWTAELNESETATAIWKALPVSSRVRRWGQEIYFDIPVRQASSPDAREVVDRGELAYWPRGSAFCIFFGPTSASVEDECRAASPVNPVGKVLDELEGLDSVPAGSPIELRRV
jgi:hypothetical protein